MRLTSFSDYSLRLLILCAARAPELVTIAEAATIYGISRNHLMKVANELTKGGFLRSVRGRNGGLHLARPAEEISIGKVVRMMEGGGEFVECFVPGNTGCVIAPACGLKFLFASAFEDFFKRLDGASLADVIRKPAQIKALLTPAA
ncbi:RrF2 family transcriptional regulator [Aestuariivirga sp.]|uniref:RrF2 family transcriptional regulator n=1 Tax=Aestuariivirga sp. TaxID=2650926 RepID=UPI0039E49808